VGSEDLLAGAAANTMREGEFQALGQELLDVWAADVGGLLDLNDLEDLESIQVRRRRYRRRLEHTWIDLKRER
jgi:hypothetical protein